MPWERRSADTFQHRKAVAQSRFYLLDTKCRSAGRREMLRLRREFDLAGMAQTFA